MNRLKEGRFKAKLTQMRLAIKVKISPAKLSYIENNLVAADEKLKRRLARVLKVDPAWLFPEPGKSSDVSPNEISKAPVPPDEPAKRGRSDEKGHNPF